jgi:hypothetical protein
MILIQQSQDFQSQNYLILSETGYQKRKYFIKDAPPPFPPSSLASIEH